MKAKKPSFKDYQNQLKAFEKRPPALTIIYGSNQFLILKAINTIKAYFKSENIPYYLYDAKDLDAHSFADIYESTMLFSAAQSPIIMRFEKQTSLFKHLKVAQKINSQQQHSVICLNSEKIPLKVLSELEEGQHQKIACFSPSFYELPDVVVSLSKEHKLTLTKPAVDLLVEALGQDLFKISNELRTISLIFAKNLNEKIPPLDINDIQEYLFYHREDHLFEFDNLLLRSSTGKSLYLLDDLLQRGESPLSILGLISHHCRKAIIISDGLSKGLSEQSICSQAKIPSFVFKNYRRYLNPQKLSRYIEALRLCQSADTMLKSSRSDSALHLSKILLEITR